MLLERPLNRFIYDLPGFMLLLFSATTLSEHQAQAIHCVIDTCGNPPLEADLKVKGDALVTTCESHSLATPRV